MQTNRARLITAAAIAIAAVSPAVAGGDVIYTGVRDPYAAAVPVPAPAPIPVYDADYYVRFDTGASWMANGEIDELDTPITSRDIDDVEAIEFGSIGAGRYITPSIRAEIAVELSTRAEIGPGNQDYDQVLISAVGPGSTDIVTYAVQRQEKVDFEQDIGMLNFYYDFRNSTRFTPYIGAGVGVTYRQLTRTASEFAECSSLFNISDPTRNCGNNILPNTSTITEGTSTKKSWDVAGALMAGVAVELTESIKWDTGYRFMWQNGGLTVDSEVLTGTSRIEIKDIGQHQIRTGIRLDLN
jgi:opacity protein-like surface antigen